MDIIRLRRRCTELLGIIAVNLNGKHVDDAFQCFTNGLKDSSVQESCVKSLVTLSKKWNDKQLNITFQCLIDGFQNINGYCCDASRNLLKGIAMKLNETQIDSLFTCLINKLKGNEWNHYLCAECIGHVSMKLNKKQLDDVFECLDGLKDENKCIRALCEKSLKTMSTKLNDKQLDRVFSAFIHGLKDTNEWDRVSCAESLETISTKLNETQLDRVFSAFIQANEKQLERVFNTLISRFKHKNEYVCDSYAELFGVISTNLTDKQLEGVFNALPNKQIWNYFKSYKKTLEEISTKWNETQSERFFNALIFFSKQSMGLVKLLKLISTKLNDKQLYLLVIHLLERAKKSCARDSLSKISEDMWKRVIICVLKENVQMKNENTLMNKQNSNNRICKTANDMDIQLLAFGLMIFNPYIVINRPLNGHFQLIKQSGMIVILTVILDIL
ncbi:hypothetical protein RFI_25726, partial [Reticulomyxa filosa]